MSTIISDTITITKFVAYIIIALACPLAAVQVIVSAGQMMTAPMGIITAVVIGIASVSAGTLMSYRAITALD